MLFITSKMTILTAPPSLTTLTCIVYMFLYMANIYVLQQNKILSFSWVAML